MFSIKSRKVPSICCALVLYKLNIIQVRATE